MWRDCQVPYERMLGREHHARRAKDRVRARDVNTVIQRRP